jgi:hypothetical protein
VEIQFNALVVVNSAIFNGWFINFRYLEVITFRVFVPHILVIEVDDVAEFLIICEEPFFYFFDFVETLLGEFNGYELRLDLKEFFLSDDLAVLFSVHLISTKIL